METSAGQRCERQPLTMPQDVVSIGSGVGSDCTVGEQAPADQDGRPVTGGRLLRELMLAFVVVASSCGESPLRSPGATFPTYYEIKMHEGNPSSVIARFREPGGGFVTTEISPPWRSATYEFEAGERIELFGRAKGDSGTLLDCQITTRTRDDPDGSSIAHGGLPRCHLSAQAGTNPFGSLD
jgi:hypothetical protein